MKEVTRVVYGFCVVIIIIYSVLKLFRLTFGPYPLAWELNPLAPSYGTIIAFGCVGVLLICRPILAQQKREEVKNQIERTEPLQAKADQLGRPVYQCNLCEEVFSEGEQSVARAQALSHVQTRHGMRKGEAQSHLRWAAPSWRGH